MYRIFFSFNKRTPIDSAGAIYTLLVRPLLPQLFVDSVFVLLAADLAGFQSIKPLGAARNALYSKIERLLLPNVAESEESTRSDATGVKTRGQILYDYAGWRHVKRLAELCIVVMIFTS
jgi:hypothetical protein